MNSYDHPDNMDSPFHRVKESARDREIKKTKELFASIFMQKVSTIKTTDSFEVLHSPFAKNVVIRCKYRSYQIRLKYDIDTMVSVFDQPTLYGTSIEFSIPESNQPEYKEFMADILRICRESSYVVLGRV